MSVTDVVYDDALDENFVDFSFGTATDFTALPALFGSFSISILSNPFSGFKLQAFQTSEVRGRGGRAGGRAGQKTNNRSINQ